MKIIIGILSFFVSISAFAGEEENLRDQLVVCRYGNYPDKAADAINRELSPPGELLKVVYHEGLGIIVGKRGGEGACRSTFSAPSVTKGATMCVTVASSCTWEHYNDSRNKRLMNEVAAAEQRRQIEAQLAKAKIKGKKYQVLN